MPRSKEKTNNDINIEIVDQSPYIDDLHIPNKDPRFHYRIVRTKVNARDDSRNVVRKQRLGYEIVHVSPDDERPKLDFKGNIDTVIRIGDDNIVMRIPKKLKRLYDQKKKERAEMLERTIQNEIEEKSKELLAKGVGKMEVFKEIEKIFKTNLR